MRRKDEAVSKYTVTATCTSNGKTYEWHFDRYDWARETTVFKLESGFCDVYLRDSDGKVIDVKY